MSSKVVEQHSHRSDDGQRAVLFRIAGAPSPSTLKWRGALRCTIQTTLLECPFAVYFEENLDSDLCCSNARDPKSVLVAAHMANLRTVGP